MRPRQTRPRLFQAMIDSFRLPDLRRRLLFTFAMLVVFRFVAHVPLPGVDPDALSEFFQSNAMLGFLDMFSGGAMKNFIIMQLMTPVIPRLQMLSQEGEAGRNKINRISHWLMIPLAGIAGYAQLKLLESNGAIEAASGLPLVAMIISIIAGTVFLVWLGEQITEYGIGNGVSIIIFGGIVAGYLETFGQGLLIGQQGQVTGLVAFGLIMLATVVLIVTFTEAHRRIPVQYARTTFRGGRMYKQSGGTHIPLRVNTAGMIPLIFAMALMLLPGTIASYFANPTTADPNFANHMMNILSPNAVMPLGLFYWGSFFTLVVGFAFFYTMVMFEQQDLSGNLQRKSGFIPGIRPGKNTKTYLDGVIRRITWAGALFLAFVAIIPFLAREVTDVQVIQLSSMGLLIVVGVVLDTMKQMEAQLVMRRYEGFIR